MANKLPQKTIDRMWAAWQEKQTIRFVSQKTHVSRTTVNRYKIKDKWEERIGKIQARAVEIADNKTARNRARDIKLVEAAKSVWAQQLTGKVPVTCPACNHIHQILIPNLKAQFRDLDTFIRLSEFLSGEADSRPEHKITVEYVDPVPRVKPVESEVVENG